MSEKKQLLEKRTEMRRQAERQKVQLIETVEKMKKKGNFDRGELAKLGIAFDYQSDGNDQLLDEISVNSYADNSMKA